LEVAVLSRIKTKNKTVVIKPVFLLETAYWLVIAISIMVKCFYFQFTTQLNKRPFFSNENIDMLLASSGILLIIMGLVLLLTNKRRVIALFICDVFFSILLMADTNFFRYYYSIITIPVVLQVDIKLLNSVDQSIISLFKVKDIIYLLDIPALLTGVIFLRKKGIEKVKFLKKAAVSILIIAIGFTSFFIIYRKADVYAFGYNSNYIAKSLGVLYSHVDTTKDFINDTLSGNDLSPKEKESVIKFFQARQSPGNKYRGIAEGKNLIVVQVEAMQQFVINRKIDGREITPNLNKLIKESLYFDSFYFQVAGGNTSDAEFLCNNSLYPAKEGAVYVRFPENTYYSLPKALKEKGYKTYALHAFSAEFWNRTEMYKAVGFDEFINGDDYVMDDFMGWEGNALSDESFFRQSLDKIDTEKPFYSFFITLSSHHPFNAFEDYDFDVGEYEGSYLGNYLKAAHYADYALGKFIQDLKDRGLYDNSLLVVYGDHSAVPKHMAYELMSFVQTDYSELEWTKLQKVPLIIHYNGFMNGEVINTTGGEIDIFPTIANLMGVDAPYALGKDLINTEKGYVILRNGSIITDEYVYLNNSREMYDIKTGKSLDKNKYRNEIISMLNELNISDLIIEKDFFSSINE